MKITPTLEEAGTMAAGGQYKTLPLSCEMLSDFTTPIEAMKILKNVSTHCYLLESAQAYGKSPYGHHLQQVANDKFISFRENQKN